MHIRISTANNDRELFTSKDVIQTQVGTILAMTMFGFLNRSQPGSKPRVTVATWTPCIRACSDAPSTTSFTRSLANGRPQCCYDTCHKIKLSAGSNSLFFRWNFFKQIPASKWLRTGQAPMSISAHRGQAHSAACPALALRAQARQGYWPA